MRWEFHSATQFERLAGQWDELNQAASGSPVLAAAFVAPLLREFGTGRELIAVGYRGEARHAMAVLQQKYLGIWETFQPAQAPMGAWIETPPVTLEALAPDLLRALPGFALAIAITQQDPELVRRPSASGVAMTMDYIQTSRITVAGAFDDYWAARGKNLRTNVKRQRSRLEKDGTVLRLDIVTDPAQVSQAIDEYGRLESAGWKGAEGTAIHPDNAQGRFYRSMLEEFCRRGAGRIFRYRYGDAVVAVDLCIESKDVLIVLKTTYDESIRTSSPSSLMRQEYFRTIFDEGRIKRIEFYGRLMEWHTRWTEEIRTLFHVNVYRWPVLPRIRRLLGEAFGQAPARSRRTTSAPATAPGAAGQERKHDVAVYEDLSVLPGRYEALFARAANSNLFSSLPWYRNFIRSALTPDSRLRIYAVDTAGSPGAACAVLLMYYRVSGAGRLGARRLIGLSNYYTSLFGPVIESGQSDMQDMFDTLAAAIAAERIGWDVIDLHPLEFDTTVFPGLAKAFGNAGFLVRDYFCFGNWYLQVRGRSYAEYFATLPSQVRNTVKRKKKQFEKSPRSRIVVYRDAAGLDEALRAYERIYASSWKTPEPFPDFISGLCRTCAKSGWLRLAVAYADDQPAAAQIWIVVGGIASIYKLAYDERFARLSLGSILTAHLMEHVIDVDQVHEVDYLTGDEAYKKDWMSHRRERRGIVAFNMRSPHGVLAALRHLAGRAIKRAVSVVRPASAQA